MHPTLQSRRAGSGSVPIWRAQQVAEHSVAQLALCHANSPVHCGHDTVTAATPSYRQLPVARKNSLGIGS